MYFCSQLESAKLKKKKKKKKTVITIRFTFKKGNIFWTLKSNYLFVKLLLPLSFSSVQSLSHVRLLATPWTVALWTCSPWLWPGLTVHHQLLEHIQTHVHWVGDAIKPPHPLSSPSPPTFRISQHQDIFKWVSSLHLMAKVLQFQLQH